MCCTFSSANNIGAKQCAALHKQFAALHQFFVTLPIVRAQVAAKPFFCKIQDGVPLKLKKNVQRPNTRTIAVD
jgi:hypothetical protein